MSFCAEKCAVVLINRKMLVDPDLLSRLNVPEQIICSLEVPLFSIEQEEFSSETFGKMMKQVNVNNHPKNTPNLLIAGAYLENEITVSILHALAEGFDVYCLTDLALPLETKFTQIFNSRLMQAGAVPSTLRQILYQWFINESDTNRRAILTKCMGYSDQFRI